MPKRRQMSTEINCNACGCRATAVDQRTVRFNVREPFAVGDLLAHDWAICPTDGCWIYYFAIDAPDRTISVTELRRKPATKSPEAAALFCFCFDISRAVVLGANALAAIEYVRARVAARECACELLNPAGTCCLGSITAERKAAGLPLRLPTSAGS